MEKCCICGKEIVEKNGKTKWLGEERCICEKCSTAIGELYDYKNDDNRKSSESLLTHAEYIKRCIDENEEIETDVFDALNELQLAYTGIQIKDRSDTNKESGTKVGDVIKITAVIYAILGVISTIVLMTLNNDMPMFEIFVIGIVCSLLPALVLYAFGVMVKSLKEQERLLNKIEKNLTKISR